MKVRKAFRKGLLGF